MKSSQYRFKLSLLALLQETQSHLQLCFVYVFEATPDFFAWPVVRRLDWPNAANNFYRV